MKVQRHTEVTIIMTEKEAGWLKALVQNPLADNEGQADTEIRQSFWEALGGAGVKKCS